MGTHYDTLGVASTASSEDIRKAYLRRARALHPDRQVGRGPAESRRAELAMQHVNAAWTVLSDPDKKSAYDRKLRPASAPAARAATGAQAARPAPRVAATVPPRADDSPGRPIDEHPGDGSVSIWASIPVLIIVGVLLGILIISAFAGGEPADNRTPVPTTETAFEIDDCFTLIGNEPRLRTCGTGSAEFIVVDLLPNVGNCPSDTQGTTDPANGRAICFKQLIPGSAVTAG